MVHIQHGIAAVYGFVTIHLRGCARSSNGFDSGDVIHSHSLIVCLIHGSKDVTPSWVIVLAV